MRTQASLSLRIGLFFPLTLAAAPVFAAGRPDIQWMVGGHRLTVQSVAFSPDGQFALSTGDDGSVKLWRVSDGALVRTFVNTQTGVFGNKVATFTPDGQGVAAAGVGGASRWTLNDPSVRIDYNCVETGFAVAFAGDMKTVGVGGSPGGVDETACLFNIDGSNLRTFNSDVQRYVFALFFHPDGQTVVTGSGVPFGPSSPGFVRYFRMSDGVEVRTLSDQGGGVNSFAISPNGVNFASAGGNGSLKIRRISDGTIETPLTGHVGEVRSAAYSPDGQFLVSTGQDGTIRTWQASNGQQVRQINVSSSMIHSVAWSSDGLHYISGGVDQSVRLWDANTGAQLRELTQYRNALQGLAVSADGAILVTGDLDKHVTIRRTLDGAVVRAFTTPNYVNSLAISPNGQLIATTHGSDTTVRVWNASNGSLAFTLVGHTMSVLPVAFSPDGQWIATGCPASEGSARLWRASNGQFIRSFVESGMGTNTVAFSPDSQVLATGGDSTVRLWNISSGTLIRRLSGHTLGVQSVDFSPDGSTLASGSFDRSARLWRVSDGATLQTLLGHTYGVVTVSFSPDGTTLATGSNAYDLTLRLWRVSDGSPLAVYDQDTGTGAFFVKFVPHSPRLA